jgi:hypothetical protein
MKLLALAAASTLALTAGACAQTKPAVRLALDCPATQGELTRTAVSADHKSCTYVTDDGGEVSLQLISVTGTAGETLKGIETSLVGDAVSKQQDALLKSADAQVADARRDAAEAAKDATEAAREAADSATEAAQVAAEAAQDAAEAGQDAEKAAVDVRASKSVHVRVEDEGGDNETAHVHLPGIHIDAKNDDAQVKIGGLTINAQDDEATVRISRDVRLKGEAFSREKRGLRATFIYTGKNLPGGYRLVGYEAAGPKVGPLAVAVVKAKEDRDDSGDIYSDVKKLVRRNAGV